MDAHSEAVTKESLHNGFKFLHKASNFRGRGKSITLTLLFKWYLFYRTGQDERLIWPRRKLNSKRKGAYAAENFIRRANVSDFFLLSTGVGDNIETLQSGKTYKYKRNQKLKRSRRINKNNEPEYKFD